MSVAYFSKVKFVPAEVNHKFSKEQEAFLRKATILLQSDIKFPEIDRLKNEEGETTEEKIRNYQLSRLERLDNDNVISGAAIKEGTILGVKYNRETADVEHTETTDTEYKINFYYNLKSNIVTFKTSNHFGDKQFNKAFSYILKQSIERESGKDCSFFKIILTPVTSKIDVFKINEFLKEIGIIKKIIIKLSTTDPSFYLTEETQGSGILKKNIEVENTNSIPLSLESAYISNLCNKVVLFAQRVEEDTQNLGKLDVHVESVLGNKYSNTSKGKYTKKIENEGDLEYFRNQSKENIEFIVTNQNRFGAE